MFKFYVVSLLSLSLVACGGSATSDQPSVSDNTVAVVDPIDKYIGKWVGACVTTSDVWRTSDRRGTKIVEVLQMSKDALNTASYEYTLNVFDPDDANCTGSIIASIVKNGTTAGEALDSNKLTSGYGKNTIKYSGESALSNGLKADKLTVSESKLTVISGEFSVGPVTTHTGYYQDFLGAQLLAFFKSETRVLFNAYEGDAPKSLIDYTDLNWTKQ